MSYVLNPDAGLSQTRRCDPDSRDWAWAYIPSHDIDCVEKQSRLILEEYIASCGDKSAEARDGIQTLRAYRPSCMV